MDLFDPTDTNHREGDISRRCNSSLVVAWLRDHYRLGKSGSISKNSVYMLYLEACQARGLETDINSTFFGKLVKKAFPGIQYNRKGPRGRSEHHYKLLKRVKLNPPSHGHAGFLPAADHNSSSPAIGLHFLPAPASSAPLLGHSQGWLPFQPQQQPQLHNGGISSGTHLPVGGTSSAEIDAIGITSSRSPSPPSSPPAPYHHLPLLPHPLLHQAPVHRHYQHRHHHQQQSHYDRQHHQGQHPFHLPQQLPALFTTTTTSSRMEAPCRCDHPVPSSSSMVVSASSPSSSSVSSSPQSSPVSRRANSPLGGWDAVPEYASACPTEHQQPHYDHRHHQQLAPTSAQLTFSAARPTYLPSSADARSWSEWNFSKMVEPAEPIPATHHYQLPAQYQQHQHHHDQQQYRPAMAAFD
jgi:hypothetical protein